MKIFLQDAGDQEDGDEMQDWDRCP